MGRNRTACSFFDSRRVDTEQRLDRCAARNGLRAKTGPDVAEEMAAGRVGPAGADSAVAFLAGGFGRGRGGNPEDMRRRTEAVRTIMEAPERLTITETDSLVIIVDGDGRTTRLSPDGKKIKDDATGIERKTKWDGDTLVSEITGAGPGKITNPMRPMRTRAGCTSRCKWRIHARQPVVSSTTFTTASGTNKALT